MPIKIMKVTAGDSENYKGQYIQRIVPKSTEELQRLIFQFIKKCNTSINALDASDTSPQIVVYLTSWREA